jgi:hypothetical protein
VLVHHSAIQAGGYRHLPDDQRVEFLSGQGAKDQSLAGACRARQQALQLNTRSSALVAGRTGAWMSSPSQPAHLSNHQRNTLRQIFQHPAGHNIEWRAVLSLLEAVGSAEEQHGGKVAVTIGSETEYFDPPPHKDIDTQAVVNLRRMLTKAGYGAGAADAGANGREG